LLSGLCAALFTGLALPPAGVWVLAFFAPVPLIWAGCRATERTKSAAIMTTLGFLPLWLYEQGWMWNVTKLGYPLLSIYLAAYAGAFVWLFAVTRRAWTLKGRFGPMLPAWIIAPIAWTALEMIRGEVMLTGYAWYLAGHPLIEAPFLAAPASLLGAYVVSFLVVALSGALADAAGWSGVSRAAGGIGAAGIMAVWLVMSLAGSAPQTGPSRTGASASATTVRVGVVQTNIPQDNKLGWKLEDRLNDWKRFADLTKEAAAARPRPDIIVWPETMFPGESLNPEFRQKVADFLAARNQNPELTPATFFLARLLELSTDVGTPLVIGAESLEGISFIKDKDGNDYPKHERRYNSVFLVQNGTIGAERYDKIERTPFGEVIPYLWRWPSLQHVVEDVGAGGMKFDLNAGSDLRVFSVGVTSVIATPEDKAPQIPCELRFVTPICFEATKSELCRRLVYERGRGGLGGVRRAALMVNVSNDGWFGPTSGWHTLLSGGRAQHLQAARWRCVELGVPMIRAVNTGISAYIDRTGKIRRAGPDGRDSIVNVDGIMVATVELPPDDQSTVFGRVGNVFGWISVVTGVALPLCGFAWRRQRQNRPATSA
jgi:apolipoprotein N-acyltransferase